MRTLYVDVYFLINFTVDILSLYFASSFAKIPTSVGRLAVSSIIGALYAVISTLFISNTLIFILFSILSLCLIIFVGSRKICISRRFKYLTAFLLFEIIIGGLVYYSYILLDRITANTDFSEGVTVNRKLLLLSVIVLLSFGILKLVILIFGNSHKIKNISVIIKLEKKEMLTEALIDSGNLAEDPFDKTPVMFIKEKDAREKLGISACFVHENNSIMKKKARIVPVKNREKTKIMYGFKPDSVYILKDGKREEINVIIVLDEEGSSYGGYSALLPMSALE